VSAPVESVFVEIHISLGAEMNHRRTDDSEPRFAGYVEGLANVGLLMPCERKSVEPMAAIAAPDRTAAQHQSLLHFIGEGKWSDEKVLAKVREMVLPQVERHGAIEAWIINDTGFPKRGQQSVGVARAEESLQSIDWDQISFAFAR
jgi:SRSO17 transposase